MKKKILCMILCVLSLVPLLTMAVSAEETATDPILRELSGFTINGKPFNEADYPVNSGDRSVKLLTMREVGADPDKPFSEWGYALYLYLYVPCAEDIQFDKVYYTNNANALEENEDVELYVEPIDIIEHKRTADGRFVRVRVANTPNTDYIFAADVQTRFYNFYDISYCYKSDWVTHVSAIRTLYTVSGFEKTKDLTYVDAGRLTLPLKLNGTVWRSEGYKSLDTPYLYNEIATVYFTIPRHVYVQYDWIEKIYSNFYMFRSSPVVVTNSETLNNMEFISYLRSGVALDHYDDGIPTLSYGDLKYYGSRPSNNGSGMDITYFDQAAEWIYNPTDTERNEISGLEILYGKYGYAVFPLIQDALSFYFYDSDIKIDEKTNTFYQVATSEDVEAYIDAYVEAYGLGKETFCGLLPELYESYQHYDEIYKRGDYYDITSWEGDQRNFWQALFGLTPKDVVYIEEGVEKILAIEDPKAVAAEYANNLDGLSNKYKIGKGDAAAFLQYLQNADGIVTLLRISANDYECRELDVHYTNSDGQYVELTDGRAWMARMNFYREVDVTDVIFMRDGKEVHYVAKADPIDFNGGVGVKNDPEADTPVKDVVDDAINKVKTFWEKLFYNVKNVGEGLKFAVMLLFGLLIVFGVVLVVFLFRRNKEKRKRK